MWLTDWTRRKSHIITPSSGAGQNYQKRIVVHFGNGVDSGEDVYLGSQSQSDFGDVRFTDNTGFTLLSYWIEKKVDHNYAIFWVKITEDLSSYDRKIYIYYKIPGLVSSIANGDNTFIFFDDFETNLDKWNLKQNASISQDYAYNGVKCLKLEIVGGTLGQVCKIIPSDIAIHAHYYDIMSEKAECHFIIASDGAGHDSVIGVLSDISQYEYAPDSEISSEFINSGIDRTIGWHEFIIKCTADSFDQPWLGGLRQFFIDGILMPTTALHYANIFLLAASGTAKEPSYWDLVFITKYITSEPNHGSWGVEESDGIGITTFVAEDISNEFSGGPLVLEEVVCSLQQNALCFEDVLPTLEVLRRTLIAEDTVETILMSTEPRIPFLSEDIISTLLAQRTFNVVTEFPSGVTRKYPVIGGNHIVQAKGGA